MRLTRKRRKAIARLLSVSFRLRALDADVVEGDEEAFKNAHFGIGFEEMEEALDELVGRLVSGRQIRNKD